MGSSGVWVLLLQRGKGVIFMITCFCVSQQVWLLSDAWRAEQWLQFSLLSLSLTFGFIPAWLGVTTPLCHRMFSTVSCFTQKSWNYLHEPLTNWLSGSFALGCNNVLINILLFDWFCFKWFIFYAFQWCNKDKGKQVEWVHGDSRLLML